MTGGVWGLILAAGRSERFDGDKLMAPLDGKPVLRHCLEAVARCRAAGLLDGLRVVLGPGQDTRERLAREITPEIAMAPGPLMADSIKHGLAQLAPKKEAAAALIVLADQPKLTRATVALLVSTWAQGDATIVRPRYRSAPDEPGHPVLIDRSEWRLANRLEGDQGLQQLMQRESAVRFVEVPGSNPDIDFPADLARLEEG